MSRLAKHPIQILSGVTVSWSDPILTVKGPKGELTKTFRDHIGVSVNDDSTVTLTVKNPDDLFSLALWGTYASHLKNMMKGVSQGFEKKLILEGVGYKAALQGRELVLALGFSHEVKAPLPEGIEATVEKNNITIMGSNKEVVGQFASYLRSLKKPEPYKGKGMRYADEIIRRKEGKKNV